MGVRIKKSVGKGGENASDDVKAIQEALNAHAKVNTTIPKLKADGKATSLLTKSILAFQRDVELMQSPSGLVKTGSTTLKALNQKPSKNPFAGMKPTERVYLVKWQGTVRYFTEKDHKGAVELIRKRMQSNVRSLDLSLGNSKSTYDDLTNWKKLGITGTFSKWLTPAYDKEAPAKSIAKAESDLKRIKEYVNSGNPKNLVAAMLAMKKIQISFDLVEADLNGLAKELGVSGKVGEKIAVDVRDGSADVAQLILVANGVNPTLAGAAVAGVKNVVQETANAACLPDGEWVKRGGGGGVAIRIVFGTLMGACAGWIGGKVGKVVAGRVAHSVSDGVLKNSYLKKKLTTLAIRYVAKRTGTTVTVEMLKSMQPERLVQFAYANLHKMIIGPYGIEIVRKTISLNGSLFDKAAGPSKTEDEFFQRYSKTFLTPSVLVKFIDALFADTKVQESVMKEILPQLEKELVKP